VLDLVPGDEVESGVQMIVRGGFGQAMMEIGDLLSIELCKGRHKVNRGRETT